MTAGNGEPPVMHLMYHRISEPGASYPYAISAACFRTHLQLARALRESRDSRLVYPVSTFDDGHRSNYSSALPLLSELDVRAHFFVTGGWIGNRSGFMSWGEVKAIHAAGHVIGSHGFTHKLLTLCSDEELNRELRDSRDILEQKVGGRIDSISMPGGRWDRRVLRACAEAGYRSVFTSEPWSRSKTLDRLEVFPRINITSDISPAQLRRYLAPNGVTMRWLRARHAVKSTAKRVIGDRLYHAVWSSLHGWKNDEQEFPA